jgi:hypothetical protein
MSQYGGTALTGSFILIVNASGSVYLYLFAGTDETHYGTAVPTDTVGIRITRVGTLITYWVDTGSGYVSHATDTSAGTVLNNPSQPLDVGTFNSGASSPLLGTISRAQVWDNGAQTGDPVVDADFRNATHKLSDTDTLAATFGGTITINGGATVYNPPIAPLHGYLHLPSTGNNHGYVDPLGFSETDPHSYYAKFKRENLLASGYLLSTRADTVGGLSVYSVWHGGLEVYIGNVLIGAATAGTVIARQEHEIILNADGAGNYELFLDGNLVLSVADAGVFDDTTGLFIGGRGTNTSDSTTSLYNFDGKVSQVQAYSSSVTPSTIGAATPVLDVDFDRAPANATSFAAKTGQTVTINQSTLTGDRAKIVKSSEIFYDGAGDEFDFTLSSTFSGKMIVASTQGILVADVSRTGSLQIDQHGISTPTSVTALHGLEQKGMMYLSDSSSPAALTSAFVARGAVKSFAARTNFYAAFRNMGLTSFPTIDVSNGVDCSLAFQNYEGTSFPALNFASATTLNSAWYPATSLTSVPAIQAPVCTTFASAWQSNTALATIDPAANFGESASNVDFGTVFYLCPNLTELPDNLDMSQGDNFNNAFNGCTSLTTIGAGVLLGTAHAAATVNFNYTFYASGLTALPDNLDMSKGSDFVSAFQGCGSLTTIGSGVLLGTASTSVNFTSAFYSTGLTALPANLDLSKGGNFASAFRDCGSLTTIGNGVLLGTANATATVSYADAFRSCTNLVTLPANLNLSKGNYFYSTFRDCSSLVTFPAGAFDTMGTPPNWCFAGTWQGNTALSGASVDAILSSIDTSTQSAPSTGPQITIDYDGTTLSAATNTAINSLIGKGWQVVINGVITVPNVLSLAPAAAYSLRSFDSAADPDVVNVRRSSDNAPSDFKASEVSDGTLTTWVNTDVDLVTPTLNNGGFEGGLTGWGVSSASADTNEFYAGTQSAKITVIGGGGAYIYKTNFSLQAGASYRVGFWAKISDASKQARVEFGNSANKEDISFTSTDWEYKEVTKTATAVTLAFNRQTGSGDYTVNFDNITVTQLTADGHVTTWYDQSSNGRNGSQFFASEQPKIVDGGALVTEGGLAAVNFHTETSYLFINHTNLYGQATLDSYYVTNATGDAYIYPTLVTNGASYGMTATAASPDGISINYGSPSYYANGTQITGGTRGDIYTATSGGQKLVAHIGADTTDSIWGTATMNFGNYYNSTIYGFTGKLQEMIFFNTDQSANRTGIEKNINDTYTIY